MQRPPLQVDPADGFWDILGALGDFFGGIFAGGALLIAAIAYKRQVDDHRRSQASSILMTLDPPVGRPADAETGKDKALQSSINPTVSVKNIGAWTVYRARLGVTWADGTFEFINISDIVPGGASLKKEIVGEVADAQLEFCNSHGRYWLRTHRGALVGENYQRQPMTLRRRLKLKKTYR